MLSRTYLTWLSLLLPMETYLSEARIVIGCLQKQALLALNVHTFLCPREWRLLLLVQWCMIWIWKAGTYERFPAKHKDLSSATKKNTLILLPGSLIRRIKGTLQHNGTENTFTWRFDTEDLIAMASSLWDDIKGHIDSVPVRQATSMFPCRDNEGTKSLSSWFINWSKWFVQATICSSSCFLIEWILVVFQWTLMYQLCNIPAG